jgi:phenylacetate-CoA ligase
MIKELKKISENIPYSIGKYLVRTPFHFRLGKDYSYFKSLLETDNINEIEYTVKSLRQIVEYAKKHFSFYRELYGSYGLLDQKINSIDDFKKFPTITKANIRSHIEKFNGYFSLNTGGTTGEPFKFYVDKNAFAREWAHMHHIWKQKDYKQTDLKITLRGKNLGNKVYKYNVVHNEFIINTYIDIRKHKKDILELFSRFSIKFIHGYPSAIFNFLKDLEQVTTEHEKFIIQKNLKTCLLGSEYPPPHIKKYISEVWCLNQISWYGHSEMCILAYDKHNNYQYKPLPTYGFAEIDNTNILTGTSFHNFDMPLIRYSTGDKVLASHDKNGLVSHFSIKEGREGEFVKDYSGNKIPLTALIFGRHHDVFDYINFIQIKQDDLGKATIFFISETESTSFLRDKMDLTNVNIDFTFRVLKNPVLSSSGKLNLLIK